MCVNRASPESLSLSKQCKGSTHIGEGRGEALGLPYSPFTAVSLGLAHTPFRGLQCVCSVVLGLKTLQYSVNANIRLAGWPLTVQPRALCAHDLNTWL